MKPFSCSGGCVRALSGLTVLSMLMLFFFLPAPVLHAQGARHFKTGPIQITADGQWVWVANHDNNSVSRIHTTTQAVAEFVLPNIGMSHSPRGLAVTEDGSEVWVACHDSDRVLVLTSDGAVIEAFPLPHGTCRIGCLINEAGTIDGWRDRS